MKNAWYIGLIATPEQSTPQPAKGIRDSKLVGSWSYERFIGSLTSIRYRKFYADGHFIEGSEGTLITSDEGLYYDNRPLNERGVWSTDGDKLQLDYDNGNQKVYKYDVDKYGLLLTAKGVNQLWEQE